jgi:hypothetical protein
VDFLQRFGKVRRRDMNQHAGGEDNVEKSIGKGDLKGRRQSELRVVQPLTSPA